MTAELGCCPESELRMEGLSGAAGSKVGPEQQGAEAETLGRGNRLVHRTHTGNKVEEIKGKRVRSYQEPDYTVFYARTRNLTFILKKTPLAAHGEWAMGS